MASTAAAVAEISSIFRMNPPDDSNVGSSPCRRGTASAAIRDTDQATASQSFAALVMRLTKRELSSAYAHVVSRVGRAEPYALALAVTLVVSCSRSAGG